MKNEGEGRGERKRFRQFSRPGSGEGSERGRTSLNHVLHRRARVNLHRTQVREPVNPRRLLSKLLRERIREVVRGVGGAASASA
jgi:hypothetical protein